MLALLLLRNLNQIDPSGEIIPLIILGRFWLSWQLLRLGRQLESCGRIARIDIGALNIRSGSLVIVDRIGIDITLD